MGGVRVFLVFNIRSDGVNETDKLGGAGGKISVMFRGGDVMELVAVSEGYLIVDRFVVLED